MQAEKKESFPLKPCLDCGGPKEGRQGQRWCDECLLTHHGPGERYRGVKAWKLANPDKLRAAHRRYRLRHPETGRKASLRWTAKNRDRVRESTKKYTMTHRERARDRKLRRRYGITLEQYNQMLAMQGGVCAVCRRSQSAPLHLDHDHDTKVIRGLLCRRCNRFIGLAHDDADILRAGAEYLDSQKEKANAA